MPWFSYQFKSRLGPLLLVLTVMSAATSQAHAQRPEVFQSGKSQIGSDLAVGGFDAVAYHTQRAPTPGKPEFRISWQGAEWRFASQANRDLFAAEPEKYAPQFGGYCAFAVGHGSTSPGDPKVWSIVNGKLYLNLNSSVQSSWNRDQANLIQRGERNWPNVLK